MFLLLTKDLNGDRMGELYKMTEEASKLYSLVGKSIKSARDKKGMSQHKLANAVKLTRTSITNIEKGRQKILLDTLWQIASILEVTIMEFIPNPQDIQVSLEAKLPENVSQDERAWIKEVVENVGN